MKFVASTGTLTVWRTGVDLSEEQNLTGLLREEARLQTAQMINEASFMAHWTWLDDARDKLLEAQNMLEEEEEQSSSLLRTELQELFQLFKTQETYETQGRLYALSSESSHDRQRLTGRGGDIEMMRLFATPRMDKYMEQANKFLNEPTKPLPSVDQDVEEELGAPTVDVATREAEMSRLFHDVGIRAMKSLPWWSCRLICWLARTRTRIRNREFLLQYLGPATVDVASRKAEMSRLIHDVRIRVMKSILWWSCRLIRWLARTRRRIRHRQM
jgi:hypothetical protein